MAKLEMLYQDKDSFLHQLDPRSKMLSVLFIVILGTIWYDPALELIMLLLAISACVIGGLPLKRTLEIALGLTIFLLLLGIIQVFSRGEPYFLVLGPIKASKIGLLYALSIGLRIMSIALVFSAFMVCTRANLITEALVKMRLPFTIAYMVTLALRFLPLFSAEMIIIQNAQQARAQETEKTILSRIRNLFTTITPLLIGSMRRSSDIALAMQLRAFGANKMRTNLFYELKLTVIDKFVLIGGTCAFIILLYLSITQGFGSLKNSIIYQIVI